MMKAIGLAATVVALFACSSEFNDLEKRRRHSLTEHHMDGATRGVAVERSKTKTRLLEQATAESLQAPIFVFVEASLRPEGGVLHGEWVAAEAFADALEVWIEGRREVLVFSDSTRSTHDTEDAGLVYSFAEPIPANSDLYRLLQDAWENGATAQAQLQREAQPFGISHVVHITRFLDGSWQDQAGTAQ